MVNTLMQNTILLNNVNVKLYDQQILSNINLEISSKHSLCLVGKGSSGKSTLLKTIIGLIKISSGDIFINNISIGEKKKFNKILNSFMIGTFLGHSVSLHSCNLCTTSNNSK